MQTTYGHQKALRQERDEVKTAEVQFRNLIVEGTNCSRFESEIVTRKAKECFRIGAYAEDRNLQPGQMVWMTVSEHAPPGKPLQACEMARVVLTPHNHEDLELRRSGADARDVRCQQLLRMALEAAEQGGLLTQEDLARILGCDPRTIRNDVRRLKQQGIVVPTRGVKKDIGPAVTHKEKVIELFLQGKESLDIARQINHSLSAVENYITTFCRVLYCQRQVRNTLQTALITGISVPGVNAYLSVRNRFCKQPGYHQRLDTIEATGQAFWVAQDFKKKASRTERRRS